MCVPARDTPAACIVRSRRVPPSLLSSLQGGRCPSHPYNKGSAPTPTSGRSRRQAVWAVTTYPAAPWSRMSDSASCAASLMALRAWVSRWEGLALAKSLPPAALVATLRTCVHSRAVRLREAAMASTIIWTCIPALRVNLVCSTEQL